MLGHRLRRTLSQSVATVSLLSYATSETGTIVIPAAAQAGDLAVLLDFTAKSSGTVTGVLPSGWTQLKYVSPNTYWKYYTSYKILTSEEPGSTLTGMDDTYDSKVMFVFRLSSGVISNVNVVYNEGSGSTGDPTDYTTSTYNEPYVVIAGLAGRTTAGITWFSLTPSADYERGSGYARLAYWLFNDAAGVDVGEAATDWGSVTIASLHALELS